MVYNHVFLISKIKHQKKSNTVVAVPSRRPIWVSHKDSVWCAAQCEKTVLNYI